MDPTSSKISHHGALHTDPGEVIEIDSDEDEKDYFLHKANLKRPPDMDPASWTLIQNLQSQGEIQGWSNNLDDDEIQVINNIPGGSPQKRRRWRQGFGSPTMYPQADAEIWQRRQQEATDLELARVLQEEIEKDQENERVSYFSKEEVLKSLTPCQLRAVNFVSEKAKEQHQSCMPKLGERVVKLGHKLEDLNQCLDYIKDEAPIIIHLKEETLNMLVGDTHYRNLFETSTSGGCKIKEVRMKWESNMFGGAYCDANGDGTNQPCQAFDRPKYGCLNITGDVRGVRAAAQYGKLHLILKQHIRHRATFFGMDTGNHFAKTKSNSLATTECYGHVMMAYSDDELKSVLNVAASSKIGGGPSKCANYKEVQIHGPVCLESDILALSLPGKENDASKELLDLVQQFHKKSSCNILWQGDLLSG